LDALFQSQRVAFMIGILATPGAPEQSPGEATCRNEEKNTEERKHRITWNNIQTC
jgi:hypothetical protein